MRPTDDIKKFFDNAGLSTNPQTDKAILDKVLQACEQTQNKSSAIYSLNKWRIIMKSKITKLAVAAVIIIAVLIGINQFGGSIDGTTVAWAEVLHRLNDVNHVHFYEITTNKGSEFPSIREGWYAHGKLRSRSCGGSDSYGAYQSFDDGQTWMVFDRHNNITCVAKSTLTNYPTFFEAITGGILSFELSQFSGKTPVLVSSDFLIYDFDPPQEATWIEKISVTVGRNSLMPIQIKIYYKSKIWYIASDLLFFDYEEPEKPLEFFTMPTETKPPHGIGQVVLGGNPVEIELHNAPGIKKAIVRLHTEFDGPVEDLLAPYRERYEINGAPVYFMEITFIIDEGYRSITSQKCPLWLNQGTKAALGKDNWPDGKYRNIRYTPVLRPTNKENVFTLELSCWLWTKEDAIQ